MCVCVCVCVCVCTCVCVRTCVFITLLINCVGVLISLLIPIRWRVDCPFGVICEWLDGWNVDHRSSYVCHCDVYEQ